MAIRMFSPPANLAIKVALKSPCRFKIGAVLAKGNHILSWGVNNERHAEVRCICNYQRLTGTLENTQLYVARVSKQQKKMGMAKPCESCQRFIAMFHVQDVWYTTSHNQEWQRL